MARPPSRRARAPASAPSSDRHERTSSDRLETTKQRATVKDDARRACVRAGVSGWVHVRMRACVRGRGRACEGVGVRVRVRARA
eukprot:5823297-Pleurochrysis_carterae.AAC.2